MSLARRICVPLALLLLLAASVYVHLLTGNAGDKNWLLLATGMWLSGKKLYVDIFEVNPPLIIWIYALPVYISLHMPQLSDTYALAIAGFIATFGVIAACLLIIRHHPQFAQDTGRQKQFVLLLLFLFIFYTANNYFFDREFILLVLTFPYMLRFMPQLRRVSLPRGLTLAIGLLAAVGFSIKPHALIIFAAIQLACIAAERSLAIVRSAENIIIYTLWAIYLFCIWHFMPEYIITVLPIALATYGGYKNSGLVYLAVAFMIFGVTFVDFRPRYRSPLKPDIYYLLWISAAYLCYALLNNGWGYTYHPLLVMGLFVSAWAFWDYIYLKQHSDASGPVQSFVFGARACAVNLGCNFAYALVVLASFFTVSACDKNLECKKYSVLVNEVKERHIHSFGVMSNDFTKWAQLARATDAKWDTRFNHLWMIKKFAESGPAFTVKNRWVLDYLDKAYAEDLDTRKPDAVFIVTNIGVKLPDFFARSEAFRRAWGHYRFVHTLDLCGRASRGVIMNPDCRYDVYERTHEP